MASDALDLRPAHDWLNDEPKLDGRVVAVDFWTYSWVNWLRTLPYVRAWHARYAEAGLVVVGVHARSSRSNTTWRTCSGQ